MSIVINFIGGEGALAGISFYNLAKIGMFNDVHTNIIVNQIDLSGTSQDSDRLETAKDEYEALAETLFGNRNITFNKYTETELTARGVCHFADNNHPSLPPNKQVYSLENKFNAPMDRQLLSIGCTDNDMNLNIKKGVYGNHRVGKVYHSDADFSKIIDVNTTDVLINVSSYYGGTGITFTPILNNINLGVDANGDSKPTFAVITAPSTAFDKYIEMPVAIPNYTITEDGSTYKLSMFRAQELLDELDNISVLTPVNKANIVSAINNYFTNLGDPTNVNPQSVAKGGKYYHLDYTNYFSRFTNELLADNSLNTVQATIINMKSDLRVDANGEFNFDITSAHFSLDTQEHTISATNLVSACSIMDIIKDTANYNSLNKGSICCYATPDGALTIDNIFKNSDRKTKDRFMATSIMVVYYLRWMFESIGNAQWIEKWGAPYKGGFLKNKTEYARTQGNKANSDQTKSFQMNSRFVDCMSNLTEEFSHRYIRSILKFFIEVQTTSKIPMGTAGNATYLHDLADYIDTNNDSNLTNAPDRGIFTCVTSYLKLILSNYFGNAETVELNAQAIVTNFQQKFPVIVGDDRLDISQSATLPTEQFVLKAKKYFNQIIGTTYEVVSGIIQ